MSDVTTRTLAELKRVVTDNIQATLNVGVALREIRDRELWREEATSFQAFLIENWGVSRSRAYQLIDSAIITTELPDSVSTMVDTERAARELKAVPPEERAEVVQAAAVDGRATASSIREVVQARSSDKAKAYDRTGFEIPPESPAMATWLRVDEINSMLTALRRIITEVGTACDKKEPMFAEINTSALVADLTSSHALLKVALPYAVCPTCQGRVLSPCTTCNGRGMISEFYWKHKVPEKTKEIRENAVCVMVEARKGSK
jgi:hypothetical protein